ncbi:hypothetical protein H6G76_33480 [Nostoc sp. FACHB-152]|uniref:hypothetical protein n=1 Tax=unclassified Nostoc TaxID=2593658 RepID=UPI001689346B|nr:MULTISPECIES: hypothetical protein [unclassified Nostoc]MBD2451949.1 hypothetical protein [Nostoc sp. FACHB-152]MBD2473041.1 hypothetical protein [Nostoc sp. FACHB-145]
MYLFSKMRLSGIKKQFSKIAIACSFFIPFAPVLAPVYAAEIPVKPVSIAQAPYSKLFFTGSVYAVKDKDYASSNSSIGFFTVWSKNPVNNDIQVGVRYHLQDKYLREPGTYLTGMTLLTNNQPLLSINQVIKEAHTRKETLHPGYYQTTAFAADPFWIESDPFSYPTYYDWANEASIYVPPAHDYTGFTRFDISRLAGAIAQLPNQTLDVQLTFNNGETEHWQLGKGTVQALKQLVAINQ